MNDGVMITGVGVSETSAHITGDCSRRSLLQKTSYLSKVRLRLNVLFALESHYEVPNGVFLSLTLGL